MLEVLVQLTFAIIRLFFQLIDEFYEEKHQQSLPFQLCIVIRDTEITLQFPDFVHCLANLFHGRLVKTSKAGKLALHSVSWCRKNSYCTCYRCYKGSQCRAIYSVVWKPLKFSLELYSLLARTMRFYSYLLFSINILIQWKTFYWVFHFRSDSLWKYIQCKNIN